MLGGFYIALFGIIMCDKYRLKCKLVRGMIISADLNVMSFQMNLIKRETIKVLDFNIHHISCTNKLFSLNNKVNLYLEKL